MEKKLKSYNLKPFKYRAPPINLYYDDLEDIFEAIDEKKFSYKITDDKFEEYVNLSELKLKNDEVVSDLQIEIKLTSPYEYIKINFERGGILLEGYYLSKLIELWHVLKHIIENKCPFYKKVFYSWLFCLFAYFLMYMVGKLFNEPWMLELDLHKVPWFIRIVIIFFLILVFFLTMVPFIYRAFKPKVYLIRRNETKSFWRTNKDQIILLVISNSLAFILGKIHFR